MSIVKLYKTFTFATFLNVKEKLNGNKDKLHR